MRGKNSMSISSNKCDKDQNPVAKRAAIFLNAKLVAEGIASQLERRAAFRKVLKKAMQNAMDAGALGVKVQISGRVGGAEIARTEWYKEGAVPLQTLRYDIDYATARAETTYGTLGVKVWVTKGEFAAPTRELAAMGG